MNQQEQFRKYLEERASWETRIDIAKKGSIKDYHDTVIQAERAGFAEMMVQINDVVWARRVIEMEDQLRDRG